MNKIIIIISIILITVTSINVFNLTKKVKNLDNKIIMLNEKIEKLEANTFILEVELNTYKNLTNEEFERTWESFAIMRNNFIALGNGFHLKDEDISPEE